MKLEDILNSYEKNIVEIELYKRLSNSVTGKEVHRLFDLSKLPEISESHPNSIHSIQKMVYNCLRTGDAKVYGLMQSTFEDSMRRVVTLKRSQYNWLLVRAYEEFENYIERIYAYIGKVNKDNWLMEDFGKIRFSEIENMNFSFYLESVRSNNKLSIAKLLSRIRELYPILADIEKNNALDLNVQLMLNLIEQIRHRIVHSNGEIRDLNGFLEKVLKQSGIWNNGNPDEDNVKFIGKHIAKEGDTYFVSLLTSTV